MLPRTPPPLLFAALALCCSACGGPDPALLLADARAHTDQAKALIVAGSWAQAAAQWDAGRAILDAHPDAMADGRRLSDHLSDQRQYLGAVLADRFDALVAAAGTSRAQVDGADALVVACAAAAERARWLDSERPAALKRLAAEAAAAQAKAAEEQRARLAASYVVWWESLGLTLHDPEAKDLSAALAATLREKVAPLPVEVLAAAPGRPTGGGQVHLVLVWHEAEYGSPTSLSVGLPDGGQGIPDRLEARLVVGSRFCTTNLDAPHRWDFTEPAPAQVSGLQQGRLADQHRDALLAKLKAALAGLPSLQDPAAVAQAFAQGAQRPRSLWTWSAKSHTTNADTRNRMLWSYESVAPSLIAAIQARCPDCDLVREADCPGTPAGSIALTIDVQEVTFGRKVGTYLNSINGGLPEHMTVTAQAAPRTGACTWSTARTWQATVAPPAQIPRSDLPTLAAQLGQQLADGIAAQVAKEPELTAR